MSAAKPFSADRRRRRTLFALLGMALMGVIPLVGYMIWTGYQEAVAAAGTATRNYDAIIEARLDATLRRADAHLQILARELPIAALSRQAEARYSRAINAGLDGRLINFPEVTGLRIFDAGGEQLYSSDREHIPRTNIGDRDYFRRLRDNPQAGLVFSEVITSRGTGRQSVTITQALRDKQGIFRGVVLAGLDLQHLQKLFQSLDLGPQGIAVIRRSDDFTQVVRWPPLDAETNKPLAPNTPIRRAVSAGKKEATTGFTVSVDGAERILSFRALERYPFFVVTAVGRDDVLAGWRMRSLAVGGAGLLLLALLAALLARLWRVEAREARGEERARAVLDTSIDAVIGMDDAGRVTEWSAAAAAIFGYSGGAALGRVLSELIIPPALRAAHTRGLRRFLATGTGPIIGTRMETTALRADGTEFPVELSLAHIRGEGEHFFSAFVRDITRQKQAQAALRASEEKYRAIYENIQDVYVESSVAGTILEISPQIEVLSRGQLGRYDFIGKPAIAFYADPNRRAEFLRALGEHGSVRDFETQFLNRDGSPIYCSVAARLIVDEQGKPRRLVATLRDIGERVRAEAQRQALEAQLRQAQKMEAVGTLAGGIAHDFNNILGAILGNVELARQDVGASHPALESLTEIAKAGRRARDLVQQILAFSRTQNPDRRAITLPAVIEEALKLLRATLPAGIDLASAFSADAVNARVLGDPTLVHQVVMNLCSNAWHAMEGNPGRIDIGLRQIELTAADIGDAGKPWCAEMVPGRYLELSVRDTGKGIDAATLEHIFDPFYTTKEVGQGTGLGLSVVHGIMQTHDGAVSVDSRPGAGSTFYLYFPALEPLPVPASEAGR